MTDLSKPSADGAEIFVSYSRRDKSWKDQIKLFLNCITRYRDEVELRFWNDDDIDTGKKWEYEIESAIKRSSAAILLVSPDFMTSNYIMERELTWIKDRADDNADFVVYPIVVRPCPWEFDDWLAKRNLFNSGAALSLEQQPEIEKRLTELVIEIERVLFQGPSDAEEPAGKASEGETEPDTNETAQAASALEFDPNKYRFMTQDEVEAIVKQKTALDPVASLNIFKIKTQQTWIVTTPNEVGHLYLPRQIGLILIHSAY